MNYLDALSDLATIVTAIVAVVAYGNYRSTLYRRIRRLECVLARKNKPNDNSLTLKQLAIQLMLTEAQVIEAASRSNKIEPWPGQSGTEYRFRLKQNPNENTTGRQH